MRETYGVLFPRFWEGTTGRQIQGKGRDAVILAAYIASCRHANMIGLYELPLVFLERELAVLKARPYILQAFLALQEVGYAQYDMRTEHTWVREMARIRVGLSSGETIDPGDNKHKAVLKLYATAKANPFLGPFFEHYRTTLRLTEGRIGPPSVPISTVDAQIPSRSKGTRKGLQRGLVDPSKQEQKQVQKQRSEAGAGAGTGKAAAAPRDAKPTQDPNPKANIESITALFTKEIFQLLGPNANPVDLRDVAMERCRALGIPCDKDVIHRAYESALYRRQLKAEGLLMEWDVARDLLTCSRSACQSPRITPGDPFAKVSSGRMVWCQRCVAENLGQQPPVDLAPAPLHVPAPTLPLDDHGVLFDHKPDTVTPEQAARSARYARPGVK